MTAEPIISLNLSVSQVNTVLAALNEAPYRVSAPLIATIMEQANANPITHTPPPAAGQSTLTDSGASASS